MHYPLDLIRPDEEGPLDDTAPLLERPFSGMSLGLKEEASLFEPGEALTTAMNAAIALGEPLLATGEPGTGKTQAAYYAGWKLNTEVFHFQVKSETTARDLLYHFNTVRYFHDAQIHRIREEIGDLDKWQYVERQILWQAFDYGAEKGRPAVVLIDEIDKAPRDVPNDILNEIERLSFHVPELDTLDELAGARFSLAEGENPNRPIVVITSNSEKGLPDPFLRRCVYHHLRMPKYLRDEQDPEYLVTVEDIVSRRLGERFGDKGGSLMSDAIALFRHLREQPLGYRPSLAELLNWLDLLLPRSSERGQGVPQRLRDLDRARCYDGITKCLLKNEKAQVGVEAVLDAWFEAQA